MKTNCSAKIQLGLMVVGLLTIVLMMGCSEMGPTSSSEAVWVPPPPMTPEHIADGPAPGYSFLRVDASQNGMVVNGDSIHIERLIRNRDGGTINLGAFRVQIPSNAIHQDLLVSMDIPNTDILACDFGPHPFQFDANVTIRMSYRDMLPPGVNPWNLTFWYWNGYTQQYEYIPYYNNVWAQWIQGYTNHFSRYVIATGS